MSALANAKALLPENHQGWDCDGSAMVCDRRLDALRALIAEQEGLRERLVRAAYGEIAAEKVLTRQFDADGLPIVPGHWREVAERRAKPYIAALEAGQP